MSKENQSDPIKFVVIGLGHIGTRHAQLIRGMNNAALVAIVDQQAERQTAIPDGKDLPFFTDLDDLLRSDIAADVAVIATPNGTHLSLAAQCLRNGWHVLIEKPMGLSSAACQDVLTLATAMNRQVFVVKQNRFSPPVVWLKEFIENGSLGEIRSVEINCFWNRDHRYYAQAGGSSWRGTKDLDGGVLFTQFSHFIDILYWFFGNISVQSAYMDNLAHKGVTAFPDTGIVGFTLSNGAIGSLHFTTAVWDTNMESVFTVVGEKGTVRIGGQYMDQLTYFHVQNHVRPELEVAAPPNDYGGYKGSAGNHIYVLQNVIQYLQTGNNKGVISGADGLQVVRIIEEMYKKAGY